MVTTTPAPTSPASDRITAAGWRIVLLASLGGTLEFYDFVIFGVFARDIAAAVFPNASPIASLMASFATFAVGYLARPFGGIVLAHYGDRYGRRKVFLWSVFVMSAATLGMGLVPSYAQWGVAASLVMVVLRLLQGFCLGGELPGALTYVVETAPRIAPLVCGVVFACVTMGVAAATAVSLSVRTWLDPALILVYGWRIAFVIGGLGGVLSFVLRRSLEESSEFEKMRSLASRQPFVELLRTHRTHVLVGCALLAGTGCFNGLFFSHLPAYLAGVLQVRSEAGRVFTDGRCDRVSHRHSGDRLDWRPHPAALPATHRRHLVAGIRLSVLSRARVPVSQSDPASGPGGTGGWPHQRVLRRVANRPIPDARSLHRRRAGLQRQLHAVQRHRAAGCDLPDRRHRANGLARIPDDGLCADRAD